jgi:DNA-binding response OmpR family regulator
MKRVLSVPCDAALLSTRESILKSLGLAVTSALGASSAMRFCDEGGFDLLLLGHTIPAKDKPEVIRAFRHTCCGPVIAMHKPLEVPMADADYNFDSSSRPQELLTLVSDILRLRQAKAASDEF